MTLDYAATLHIHQWAVALSVSGFIIRGAAGFAGAAWVRGRLAKTLPHLVDTVLLVSALMLAVTLRLTPGQAPWLMAKLAGLVVYVGLGIVALRSGKPLAVRITAWLGALGTVGWMVSVAITKNPLGFLAALA